MYIYHQRFQMSESREDKDGERSEKFIESVCQIIAFWHFSVERKKPCFTINNIGIVTFVAAIPGIDLFKAIYRLQVYWLFCNYFNVAYWLFRNCFCRCVSGECGLEEVSSVSLIQFIWFPVW